MTASTSTTQRTADHNQYEQSVDSSRRSRERMLKAMRVLEGALAKASPNRESAWRKAVITALVALQEAMQHQADELNGSEGLVGEILQDHPRLQPRIQKLRQQHEDLLRQIGSLSHEFTSTSDGATPDVADIRQRLAWLVTALRHFHSRETDLIYEAIQVDIGQGD